jgi:hypothetical protein
MVAKERTFYCVVCMKTKTSRKYSSLDRFREFEPVFVPNKACHYPNLICGGCSKKLENPYEIVLKDGTIRRAIHVTSRHLREVLTGHEKQEALLAVDLIPFDTYLPYPGKIVPVVDYENFKLEYGTELSHEYAKGGPKDLGIPTIIFGQYATASSRSCAQFVNSAGGLLKVAANCKWGYMTVDDRFIATYPDLDRLAYVPGSMYPGMRVTAPNGIQPGEEFFVKGYGSGFWMRKKREASGQVKVTRPVALKPSMLAALQPEERRGMKRARRV